MTHISDRQTNERTNAEHAKIPTTTSARHVKQQSMTKNFDRKLFCSNFYVNLFSNAFQSIEYDLLLYFQNSTDLHDFSMNFVTLRWYYAMLENQIISITEQNLEIFEKLEILASTIEWLHTLTNFCHLAVKWMKTKSDGFCCLNYLLTVGKMI